MLYAYVQRFDVMRNLEKFYKILETKQAPKEGTTVGSCRTIQINVSKKIIIYAHIFAKKLC